MRTQPEILKTFKQKSGNYENKYFKIEGDLVYGKINSEFYGNRLLLLAKKVGKLIMMNNHYYDMSIIRAKQSAIYRYLDPDIKVDELFLIRTIKSIAEFEAKDIVDFSRGKYYWDDSKYLFNFDGRSFLYVSHSYDQSYILESDSNFMSISNFIDSCKIEKDFEYVLKSKFVGDVKNLEPYRFIDTHWTDKDFAGHLKITQVRLHESSPVIVFPSGGIQGRLYYYDDGIYARGKIKPLKPSWRYKSLFLGTWHKVFTYQCQGIYK